MTEAEKASAIHASTERAFGITHGQNEKIRMDQIHGRDKKIPANNAANISDQVFAELYTGYEIPWHEANHYHVAMEARLWDQNAASPSRLSSPQVQVYDVETFKMIRDMKPTNGFNGYITHILHDPTKESKAVKKEAPGTNIPDDLADLTTAKQAKAYYKELTGEELPRTTSLEKAIEKIIEFRNKK